MTRTDIQPLTFGGGVHFCLGAALARAEIEITFRTLLQPLRSTIELRGEAPCFQDRLTLRGLTALDVACRAAGEPAPRGTPHRAGRGARAARDAAGAG